MADGAENFLVLVEHSDNQIDSLSLQLLKKARQLADRNGATLTALVLGSDLGKVLVTLGNSGADRVLFADYPELNLYNPELFTKVVAEMAKPANPDLLLMGYSFLGMEVGPALAVRLGVPLLSNCVDLDLNEDGNAVVSRSIYGGAWQVKLRVRTPIIVSIQKGALGGGGGNERQATIAGFPASFDLSSLRTRVVEIQKPAAGEVDITKAEIIVAAGRGIGQVSNLNQIRGLARALGGVVAGTRPVIDMGWLPGEYLVGLSGKTVTPRVYIACGISGSAQHLAAMSESQMIIAINKDANAPIFSVAHYAIVGDLFELVPAITEEIEKRR